jgi:hypothetical protein
MWAVLNNAQLRVKRERLLKTCLNVYVLGKVKSHYSYQPFSWLFTQSAAHNVTHKNVAITPATAKA